MTQQTRCTVKRDTSTGGYRVTNRYGDILAVGYPIGSGMWVALCGHRLLGPAVEGETAMCRFLGEIADDCNA